MEDLLDSSETFKLAVDSGYNHIIITNVDGVVLYANSAVERITGYGLNEIIGNNPRLWGQQMSSEFYKSLWETIKVKRLPFKGQIINKRKNGEKYIALATISPIISNNGELLGFIGTEDDITELINARKDLEERSHDLEKMNTFMINREIRISSLKNEVKELKKKLGIYSNDD
ncbi:MAG: PAS domain-containing protein [bacterium]